MGCIYMLVDRSTNVPRYVGLTTQDPVKRLAQHLCDSKRRTHHVNRWIAKTGCPEMFILETCADSLLPSKERAWISLLRTLGCPLTNLTDGGDAVSPDFWTERRRAARAEAARKQGRRKSNLRNYVRTPEDEQRRKAAAKLAIKGKPLSPKHRAKIGAALARKVRWRGVTYPSQAAMARTFGVSPAVICNALKRGKWRGKEISRA